jgi:hypothetical protein
VAQLHPQELGSHYVASYNSQGYNGGTVEVKLRPRVSRPVYLGVGNTSEAQKQIFFSAWQMRVSWCGEPSLPREWVCNLLVQLLLGIARAVILGSTSRRTRDHILLSHLRLSQLGGSGSRINILQEQGVSGSRLRLWFDGGMSKSKLSYHRLSVGQSILMLGPPSGARDQFLLWNYGAFSLTRGRTWTHCQMSFSKVWDSPNMEDQFPYSFPPGTG